MRGRPTSVYSLRFVDSSWCDDSGQLDILVTLNYLTKKKIRGFETHEVMCSYLLHNFII